MLKRIDVESGTFMQLCKKLLEMIVDIEQRRLYLNMLRYPHIA
ncbi:hypothetical protein HMPREF0322_02510 [Desulfitobacterium hafniense DP7]|uniref:Uncharacterized protein n=1 Tax=Desulfitobacterium hafniense DP7 TaxID=537010 RepID=G9XNG8_DESHA|nr:hypothetical protein HMPREF0322_02510 [Desulfitobacterium hafniense DP7]